MFGQIRDGWRLPKILNALKAVDSAIAAGHLDVARDCIASANDLVFKTKFPRTIHINLSTTYGFIGIEATKRGDEDLAERCRKMSELLQARFNAGDYYLDPESD